MIPPTCILYVILTIAGIFVESRFAKLRIAIVRLILRNFRF